MSFLILRQGFSAPPPNVSDGSSDVSTDNQCKTNAKADIILLVDGSWSIGRMNFKTIRNFIARTVSVFDIGPERVQIGNVVSADPACRRRPLVLIAAR